MSEVKSTDNKNTIDNNITLFAFFCQLVKSLRRFSAVSSRSCSKWATNGSPLPVVRNQKSKGREKSLKPLKSNLLRINLVEACCYCFLTHCWCPRMVTGQKKEWNDNCFLNLYSEILKSTLLQVEISFRLLNWSLRFHMLTKHAFTVYKENHKVQHVYHHRIIFLQTF